jgi:hypothetical protein
LPDDQPRGEPLEGLHHHFVHRSEVVMDEAVVHSGLFRQPARGHRALALRDEQGLGRIEDRGDSLRAGAALGGIAARGHGRLSQRISTNWESQRVPTNRDSRGASTGQVSPGQWAAVTLAS